MLSTTLPAETTNTTRTERLINWTSQLTYDQLPQDVIERTKDFFLDWLACTIAGRDHTAVKAIMKFSMSMGPVSGRSELIGVPEITSSPAFAALVNAASSHVVEQDDLHNSSMMHPATVVFPAALAVAQEVGATGKEFITSCVVGYEIACRAGEYLGKDHYANFHSTATTGVLGAAVSTAYLLKLDADHTLSALGTAGTQAAGLWQYLLDATHSKQVHTAKACFDGIFAAYTAQAGLLGPRDILEGKRGMGMTLSTENVNPLAIDSKLGSKFSILESSFKWHASCRHTHPSVDALLALMQQNNVAFDDIESVTARTYRSAISILSMSEKGETVHQSKFSMGFVLAVAAMNGQATISDFTTEALKNPALRQFQRRVTMVYDAAIESEFPARWIGIVEVRTKSGKNFTQKAESVKGDPDFTLTRQELEFKMRTLAAYGEVKDMDLVEKNISRAWNLENETDVNKFAMT